jgi:hypothetical protein
VENPTPAVVIRVEAPRFDNAILLDYLTSEVVLEEPEIGSTGPDIPIANYSMDDQLHFGMAVGSGNFEDAGDECDAFPTASWRRRAMTELEMFHLGTSVVNGYESEDGDDADAANEEEASQATDGSTQNVED